MTGPLTECSLSARFGVLRFRIAGILIITTERPMDRIQLLARIEKAWRDFQQSYAGLSDSQLITSGVTGEWSVRDILAHVTTWEQEALKHLPTILEGRKPPRYSVTYGGINGFNRTMTEKKKALTLAEVRHELEDIHRQV